MMTILIIILTAIALWGVKQSVTIAILTTVLELAGLLLIIVISGDDIKQRGIDWSSLTPEFSTTEFTAITSGAFLAFFAFIGFEDMVHMAEEVKNPQTNLPLGIAIAVTVTTLLYATIAIVALQTVPLESLASSPAPMVLLVERNSDLPLQLMGAIGVVAMVNGILLQIIMVSRVLYGMAKRQLAPALLSSVCTATRTPIPATLLAGSLVLAFALWLPVTTLARATSCLILLVFTFVNLSLLSLHYRERQRGPLQLGLPGDWYITLYWLSCYSNLELIMTLPREMACIEIGKPGSAEVLTATHRPVPIPGDNEVLIRVRAAGVNRPDVLQRQGRYPPPKGSLGYSGSGSRRGNCFRRQEWKTNWQVGQSVCALLNGGGYSEYAIAHETLCLPIPSPFNLIQAAAIPETFFTVWSNLFQQNTLQPGETLLVHGGSSGVGTTAIQLANMLDHRVFTTAGSDEKCAYCLQLGAEAAINYRKQDFVEEVKALTDGAGADVILDMVGGDYVGRNIHAAAFRARILSIAFLKGSRVEVDLMPVMLKQLVLTGSTLRARPVSEKAAIARSVLDKVWPLLENGAIAPVINETFPLAQAAKAHQLMESSEHIGKIVLTLD